MFLVAKINVVKRRCGSRSLFAPGLSGIVSMQNRAGSADDPTVLFIYKVDVNQFVLSRRLQPLPDSATVSGNCQNAAGNVVALTGRANHPAALFATKSQTVNLRPP